MSVSPNPTPAPQRLVLWVIWAAIFGCVWVIQLVIGHGLPSGRNAPGVALSPIAFVALSEVVAATAIRWLWIPRLWEARKQLVAMVIGLALAEGSNFLGLFLIPPNQPETKLLIFVLAVVGVVQFAPIYARAD